MEFKFRAVDQQPPFRQPFRQQPTSSSSGSSYFTQQAIRAGYRISGFGPANEYFNPGLPANGYSGNPIDGIIARELEKERIREKIIAAEVARRQALEDEVRREIMNGREFALQARGVGQGSAFDRYSSRLGDWMVFEPKEVPFQHNKGWLLEEKIAMSLEKRLGMKERRETKGIEIVPFQRGSIEPKIKEIIPSHSDTHKEKDKIVILVKPDTSLSGEKRKAVPPQEENASEHCSNGATKKKIKEEWSCALCQVTATSEHGLNEHIQGKKHKSKETALRAQWNGNNIGIGVVPKNVVKPAVEVTHNLSSELGIKSKGKVLQFNNSGEFLLQTNSSTEHPKENNASILKESDKTDKSRKKNLVGVQKAPRKVERKKKRFTFWCEMCQVGAFNEKVMEAHRKGKKHMTQLQEARENGKGIPSPRIVGIQDVNDVDNAAEEGFNKNIEDIDAAIQGEDEDKQAARRDGAGLD